MVLIQDASFEKPPIKNWKKKYIQLDFTASIAELEKLIKDIKHDNKPTRKLYSSEKEWLNQKWLLTAFMKKCQCEYCKPGWDAYEEAVKGIKQRNRFVRYFVKHVKCAIGLPKEFDITLEKVKK